MTSSANFVYVIRRTNAVVMVTSLPLHRRPAEWEEGRPVDDYECSKTRSLRWCASSAARRSANPKTIDCLHILRAGFSRPDSKTSDSRRTSSTAGHVVTVQVRYFDVSSFESAGAVDWYMLFYLVELARWSLIRLWSFETTRRWTGIGYFVWLNLRGGLWSGKL